MHVQSERTTQSQSHFVKFCAVMAAFLILLSSVLTSHAFAEAAPHLPGATADPNEYLAFRDVSGEAYGFQNTLWIQNVTACREDADECRNNPGTSKSFQVVYCLHQNSQMPYDSRHHSINIDPQTGLVTNAQKYWRYSPSDRLIRNSVKYKTGDEANLRKIKKVLFHGYHDADDSQWQIDNNIKDEEFREGTQYALWHYTDNLDTSNWAWQNQNVKKVYEYLVDLNDKLPEAPVTYELDYYHTNEAPSDSHYTEYQDLVGVRAAPPAKAKRVKIRFKKVDAVTGQNLSGAKILVVAYSKLADDGTVLYEKTVNLTNDGTAVLDDLTPGVAYGIEETVVPDGYERFVARMEIDENGNITFYNNDTPPAVEVVSRNESNFLTVNDVTIKNVPTTPPAVPDGSGASLATTVKAGDSVASSTAAASVDSGSIRVVDTVSYSGLIPNNNYTFSGRLMKIVEGSEPQEVKTASTIVSVAANQPSGTVEIDFGSVSLEPGARYVVFEKAVSENAIVKPSGSDSLKKHEVSHEDANDKAQTISVKPRTNTPADELKTVINLGRNYASTEHLLEMEVSEAELADASQFHISDTITYDNPRQNMYKLVTVLNKVEGDVVTPVQVKVADSVRRVGNFVLASFRPDHLEFDTKYVVYEYLFDVNQSLTTQNGDRNISDADKALAVAKHENPNDNAQSFIFRRWSPPPTIPSSGNNGQIIRTTVEIDGLKSTSERPIKDPDPDKLIDYIEYKGLTPGATYLIKSEFVEEGTTVIKTFYNYFVPEFADGVYALELSTRSGDRYVFDWGWKYTVFEYMINIGDAEFSHDSDWSPIYIPKAGKFWIEHADANDLAQSFYMYFNPRLQTTVKAGESLASSDAAAEVQPGEVSVVDTVKYDDLEVGKAYVLKAELMEDGSKAIKTVYLEFAPETSDGQISVDFGKVSLELGKRYVVFESAIRLKDANKTGEGDQLSYEPKSGKSWIEHTDPKDKAQTIVVVEAPQPPAPDVPDKPGNPDPNKPNNPAPNTPEKPGEPEPGKVVPKTGDASLLVASASAFTGLVACGLAFASKKRR